MSDLFESGDLASDAPRPLADRLRPKALAEVVGQDHLLNLEGPLGRMVGHGRCIFRIRFWLYPAARCVPTDDQCEG